MDGEERNRWLNLSGPSRPAAIAQARLSYHLSVGGRAGDKYLCVVVKVVGEDACVLPTYLADKDAQSEKRRGASRHCHVAPRA